MKSRVHNPKYLEKYFTQFPNIIDDSDLDPYEYRLLLHYYRVGECWEGVRKTAEICKMSTGKVANSRKTLEEKGLIKITENGDGIIIHLVDLSKQNLERYTEPAVHVVNTYKEGGCSCGEKGCPCGEHKKNQSKKNPLSDSNESVQLSLVTENKKATKKEKLPYYPEYNKFIDLWIKHYPTIGIKMPRDGAKIKSLIEETRRQIQLGGGALTQEAVCNFWAVFLDRLKGNWYDGKDLPTIESKYSTIIFEMQNGKPKNKPTSIASAADEYIKRFKEGIEHNSPGG